jgi:hypothetical protein
MGKFSFVTMTYGMIRAIPRSYDREKDYFNTKLNVQESKQMLLTRKLGLVVVNGGMAICCWPWLLMNDITLLELILRGKDPMEHGFDKHWETEPFN